MQRREPSAEQIAQEKLYLTMGLTEEEYDRIVQLIGRKPNYVETGMFGAMWSEHCSYKNSKPVLRLFPTEGPRVLQGPGEGAGVVDIGDGQAVVFKIESHNHPSAVHPFNGAATGIGGIVRDVFSMGARPIALLNSLRFGPLSNERVRELVRGVTEGLAFYGNGLNVPTVGGEVYFDESYLGNPLVNAMCVGVIDHEDLLQGVAKGEGNLVVYAGRETCRDGIQGATFASEEFSETGQVADTRVPSADPELERRLMEACLEIAANKLAVGMQDMGAAGLTSSSAEMAAKAGHGMVLDLDKVPQAEAEMTPYEMMLSETQERMLLVVTKDKVDAVQAVFDKWKIRMAIIGHVSSDGQFVLRHRGEEVSRLPVRALVDDAPVYHRKAELPNSYCDSAKITVTVSESEQDVTQHLRSVLQSPSIASKRYVYNRFDGSGSEHVVVAPGSDAGIVRIPETNKLLAMTVDGNSRYVSLDPYTGGAITVAEAARNLVCSGAEPLALTDGLNFGNPEKPDIFWQIEQSIQGMSDACRALSTPVIGGNVSLYNETAGQAIHPTPIIGMVGLVHDESDVTSQSFQEAGDVVVLFGETYAELGGSEWQAVIREETVGRPPKLDLERERAVQQLTLQAIQRGFIQSAHDLSEGGLAVALSEACFGNGFGVHVNIATALTATEMLFSESQSRILVSVKPGDVDAVVNLAETHNVPCTVIGEVTDKGSPFTITVNGKPVINESVSELAKLWEGAFEWYMTRSSMN